MSKDKYRLLVADDDSPVRDHICMVTEFSGWATAEAASNGQEALSKLETNSYDLILMDCQMPVIDGYEATRRLRALGNNTPIIGLTAVLSPEARAKGLAAGMNQPPWTESP